MEPVFPLLIVIIVAIVVVIWISGPKDKEKEKNTLEGILMCVAGLGLLVLFVRRRTQDEDLSPALFLAGIFFSILLVLAGAYVITSTWVDDFKITIPKTTQSIVATALAVVPAALAVVPHVNWDFVKEAKKVQNYQTWMIEGGNYFSQKLVESRISEKFQILRMAGAYHILKPFSSEVSNILFETSTKQRRLFDQNIESLQRELGKIGVGSVYTLFFGLTKDVLTFIKLILTEYGFNTTQNIYKKYVAAFKDKFNPTLKYSNLGNSNLILSVIEKGDYGLIMQNSGHEEQNDNIAITVEETRSYETLLDNEALNRKELRIIKPLGDIHVKMVVLFPKTKIETWQGQINKRKTTLKTQLGRDVDAFETDILLDFWSNNTMYNTIVNEIVDGINQQLSDIIKRKLDEFPFIEYPFYIKCDATEFEFTGLYTPIPALNDIQQTLLSWKLKEAEAVAVAEDQPGVVGPKPGETAGVDQPGAVGDDDRPGGVGAGLAETPVAEDQPAVVAVTDDTEPVLGETKPALVEVGEEEKVF